MTLWDSFSTAGRALLNNKLRSILTVLGILIGVAAVVAVLSLGRAQQTLVEQSFASLGSNLIYVTPPQLGIAGIGVQSTLTLGDAQAIAREATAVQAVAPTAQTYALVVAGAQSLSNTIIAGVAPVAQQVNNYVVSEGSFITDFDYGGIARVAVLGNQVATSLFSAMDPVGQSIRIGGRQFEVIGVLATRGVGLGTEDLEVYVPLSTFYATLSSSPAGSRGNIINMIAVQAKSGVIQTAEQQITTILRQQHNLKLGQSDDFRVYSLASVADQLNRVLGIIRLVLVGIAGISLVVGGIGIMNIMLVSVTERTREIGIRMAVGAKTKAIRTQFMAEALTLSMIGGILGTICGVAASKLISAIAGWSTVISGFSIILAFGFSALVGIFFGYYPAYKASLLDPILALRYE